MIQTIQVLPGVTLRCFPDGRFKQETISLQFVRPMCREEAARNALLPAVLLQGCRSAPNMRAVSLRLDDLYGAAVSDVLRRVGDYQATGLRCGFLREDYALPGEQIFQPMLDFLQELLFFPKLENGVFCREAVENEKRNLLAAIAAQQNDKRVYAGTRMVKLMCRGDTFGIPNLGEKEDVAAITPENLYAHYQKVLAQSPVNIFYVGAMNPEHLADHLRPIFAQIPRDPITLPPQAPFRDLGGCRETEVMDVTQGRLCMGFITPITLADPRFVAMQLFNAIFGNGMVSKLFMNLREKMSLCYDIGSSYRSTKGILTVAAGIDSNMAAPAEAEIMRQLAACQNGEITQAELDAAKEELLSGLRSVHDSPGAIEGYYATGALSGMTMTPAEYIRAVGAVTAAEVAEAAKSVRLHTVYFLRGAE